MKEKISLNIKKLPEGAYLATSDEAPGVVAQGQSIEETMRIAYDVAAKISDAQIKREVDSVR